MREPRPGTFVPDTVLIKRTNHAIELTGNPELTALTVAIAEDFMAPMAASGSPDIISAAADAEMTMRIVDAAGLRLIDKDAPEC